jgi:hypothetical protein
MKNLAVTVIVSILVSLVFTLTTQSLYVDERVPSIEQRLDNIDNLIQEIHGLEYNTQTTLDTIQ